LRRAVGGSARSRRPKNEVDVGQRPVWCETAIGQVDRAHVGRQRFGERQACLDRIGITIGFARNRGGQILGIFDPVGREDADAIARAIEVAAL
jgi:hypothetical protein